MVTLFFWFLVLVFGFWCVPSSSLVYVQLTSESKSTSIDTEGSTSGKPQAFTAMVVHVHPSLQPQKKKKTGGGKRPTVGGYAPDTNTRGVGYDTRPRSCSVSNLKMTNTRETLCTERKANDSGMGRALIPRTDLSYEKKTEIQKVKLHKRPHDPTANI